MSESSARESLDKLNDYSKRFVDHFLSKFPQWKPYVTPKKDDYSDEWIVEMLIPSPLSDDKRRLFVGTGNEEVTVGYGQFHTHFSYGNSEMEDFQQATEFVQNIIDEKTLFVNSTVNGKWDGSETFELGDKPDLVKPGARVLIQSWLGTYDREYYA